MRICLLTRFFNRSNGGIGSYSAELLKGLLERGYELDLLSTTWGGTAGYFLYTALELKLKIPNGCDLYHACTPIEAIHLPRDKPTVFTCHDLIPWLYSKQIKTWYFGGRFGRIRRWIGHHYFKFGVKRALKSNVIIANSKQTRDDLISVGANESKIRVVRLGIPSDMELKNRSHNSGYTIGTLSYLDPRKRIHLLIEAFKKTDIDGRLLIAGKGMDKKRLEGIAGNDERIRFLDFVPNRELADFYRSLDVFVLPTQSEGYCMPIVESLACGTPVITLSDAIIPWDVREHTKSVTVEELPNALQNPPKIRGRNIEFAQKHDWGAMVDVHTKIYEEVAG